MTLPTWTLQNVLLAQLSLITAWNVILINQTHPIANTVMLDSSLMLKQDFASETRATKSMLLASVLCVMKCMIMFSSSSTIDV